MSLSLIATSFILIALTATLVVRLRLGKPAGNPTEIIFVTGIMLGGLLMWFGLQNVGSDNFKDTLGLVVAHLTDAIAVNVLAMACKLVYVLFESSQAKEGTTPIDADTQHLIGELSKVLKDNQRKTDESLATLNATLLANQEDSAAKFDQLDSTLRNFAENLSKEFVEKLGGALQNLISSLEDKITKNLGDSFRSLGVAVEEMVKWQAQYKEDLNTLMAANEQISKTLLANANSFADLANQAQVFSTVAHNMEVATTQIRSELDELTRLARSLQSSLESLASVPEVATQKMNEYVSTLKEGSKEQKEALLQVGEQLEAFGERLEHLVSEQMGAIESGFEQSTLAFHDAINKSNLDYANGLNEFFDDFRSNIESQNSDFRGDLSRFHADINQKITDQIAKMESTITAVRDETAKSLDEAMREFSRGLVDVLAHGVNTAKNAYSIATNTKDAFERARR